MKRERKSYDRSFKIMAVELAVAKGSIPVTAKELGIHQDYVNSKMICIKLLVPALLGNQS